MHQKSLITISILLVISYLKYAEAIYFRHKFPGLLISDVCEMSKGGTLESRKGFTLNKHGKMKCAKQCYKKVDKRRTVGFVYNEGTSTCTCVKGSPELAYATDDVYFCKFKPIPDPRMLRDDPQVGVLLDSTCRRPHVGQCSQAGSCCNKIRGRSFKGTRRNQLNCLLGECSDFSGSGIMTLTKYCKISCPDADKDAYGEWVEGGECERPAEGVCSQEGSCCETFNGKQLMTRSCLSKAGCIPSALVAKVPCQILCAPPMPIS